MVGDDGGTGECLVDLHGRAAGVGEDVADAAALKSLDEDVGALAGIGGAPRPERGGRGSRHRQRGGWRR